MIRSAAVCSAENSSTARASTRQAMTAPVTMRQIAERAQVSMGTVSHVINETAIVRPKLRERVLDAIGPHATSRCDRSH